MTDDHNRWARVKEIFQAALERTPEARHAYLDRACANDSALRREVDSMLRAHVNATATSFAGQSAIEGLAVARIDVSPYVSGQQIGHYRIEGVLGAGGMGIVYRGRDTKLNRDVALKILPDAFANDPDRLARFKREAHVLASLNHPNIAAIYGFEDSGSTHALVLELVEGPTLGDRIAKGPLPLDEALPIAKQIAEALEVAHEHGIVHRDLKPANVSVLHDGTVKVLDFGLAKLISSPVAPDAELSASPTLSIAGTTAGVILGTVAYMSPEQARGKPIDRRTDIWAFGCVLFEMLTGTRAFDGDDISATLAEILKSDPDWNALPAGIPPVLRRLLARCLKKDPKDRLQAIGDARIEITDAIAGGGESSTRSAVVHPRAAWRHSLPWAVAALLAIALAGTLLLRERTRYASSGTTRLELMLPLSTDLASNGWPAVSISPDGSQIAFVASVRGVRRVFVRRFNQFDAAPLTIGSNINVCFFSPDGGWIAVITNGGDIRRVSLANGVVDRVASEADFPAGGAWTPDDRIVFGRNGALWQVAASGGSPVQLTQLDTAKGERLHAFPTVAGRTILFTVVTGSGEGAAHIEALNPATGERHVLVDAARSPVYAPSGHLLFFRDGALLAAPFDATRLQVTGSSVRVLDNIAVNFLGIPEVALSPSGVLAYASSTNATRRLVWVNRQGAEEPITSTARSYENPRLSPDGRRIVTEVSGKLWIHDLVRSTFTGLTTEDTVGNSFAAWTPDSRRVLFRSLTGIHVIDADGNGHAQPIAGTKVSDVPTSVSPDGSLLAFVRQNTTTAGNGDQFLLALSGSPNPRPIVATPDYDGGGQFSPDGRWLAYVSQEPGRSEVYVHPYPGPDRKVPVSTDGGTHPRWRRDGKELFYRSEDKMLAVKVSMQGNDIVLSQPMTLFERHYSLGTAATIANYDVSLDGQRFLMVKDDASSDRLNVVLNWFEELRRLAPVK
jgi:serine/threonine protein kinase/Tol biopolymer transport system component